MIQGKTSYNGYMSLCEKYRYSHTFDWRTTQDVLWSLALEKKPCHILDYGCGSVGTLGFLGDVYHNGRLVADGYDPNPNEKAIYSDRSKIDEVYDLIICSNVLEHTYYDQLCDMLDWSRDHCRRLAIVLPNHHAAGFDLYEDLTHIRPYDTHHLPAYMEWNGWNIEKIAYSNRYMWWQMPPAFVLSLKRMFRGGMKGILQGCFQDYVLIATPSPEAPK